MAPIFGAILFANAHYPRGIPTGFGARAIAIRCAQHVDHDVSIKAFHNFWAATAEQPPCVNFDLADWNIIYQNLPMQRHDLRVRYEGRA
jgi:hypothetical protein